jgi:general secretion pathway protein C
MTPLQHSTTRRFLLLALCLALFPGGGALLAARHAGPQIIRRELLDRLLANSDELCRSARIVPRFVDGRARGFRLYAIRPGSIFHHLGLENGDTLIALNGFDLSSPDRALEAYVHLRSASSLTLELERRGQRVTLEYLVQ